MAENPYSGLVNLGVERPIWERFFMVAPLVVVGSREQSGDFDLAPKHMVTPLSWENHIGFVCAPTHSTYTNIERERAFTISYPRPEQVILTSLAAAPRCDDGSKTSLQAVPTFPARLVEGVFLCDSYLFFECELERIVDGFGLNSLIAGKIIAAYVHEDAQRNDDRDDQDVVFRSPLLAYLYPGRFASIEESHSFPFPEGFRR
jgi:flavin reductase (DIM6/NTAB) family NADH-FMN oxidoreductase RutF